MEKYPLVSVGVPVFNGEKELADTLISLINQDYPRLEIIVSDNGSTDSTSEICKEFVKKDDRIKYYHSTINYGATWNFNKVFEKSSGKYFIWAAHDDKRDISFVSACVEKMEQCPKAVLCQCYTATYIEGNNETLCITNLNSFEGVTTLTQRYWQVLKHYPATAIYGLYRASAMRKTRKFENVMATDLAFIQELSLQGNFVQVPEVLFTYMGRKKWNTVNQDYKNIFGKDKKPLWYLPFLMLFCNHWSRLRSAKLSYIDKICLWFLLVIFELWQISLKVLIRIIGKICPLALKEKLAWAIYRRWMLGPNLEIRCEDLFMERIIKPKLGWWK